MKLLIINILRKILKVIIIIVEKTSFKRKTTLTEQDFMKEINYQEKDMYENVEFDLKENTLDVSIVIPVYNAKKYLEECLDSILNQNTNYKYEVICVNDGSKDNSLSILKKYAKKYDNLIVIDQRNQGISGARNTGIKNANGKYIGFIDNDDHVSNDYIEKLLSRALSKNADIVKCNHTNYLSDDNNKVIKVVRHNESSIKGNIGENILEYKGYIWGGIFKKNLFQDVRFPMGYRYEDIIMRIILMRKCKQFEYIDENLYFYNVHNNNASKIVWKSSNIKCLDQYFLSKKLLDYSKKIKLKDNGEVYLILSQELGNVLWLRTRKLKTNIRKKIFYISSELINQYEKKNLVINNFESRILKKSFNNKDYFLWNLISMYMMVGIKYGEK